MTIKPGAHYSECPAKRCVLAGGVAVPAKHAIAETQRSCLTNLLTNYSFINFSSKYMIDNLLQIEYLLIVH